MRVIRGLKAQGTNKPSILTIGNFDGMHLGHQELVKQAVKKAQGLGVESGLLTFEPHPMKVLAPQKNLKNIFDLDDRLEMASQLGLDFVLIEPFSRDLSEMTPSDFVAGYLKKLRAKALFVGHDFTFGKDRSGTIPVLEELCEANGLPLTVVSPVKLEGEIISSSKIREAVIHGNMPKARAMLGRWFYLKGVVEKGEGRGRKIGFPTANLFTSAELLPKIGIYVTTFELKGQFHRSVTNVGRNPTFEKKTEPDGRPQALKIETFIFDFDKDIYGEVVRVNFLQYQRDELKFNSVDDLVKAIKDDVKLAEAYPWQKI